MVTIETIIHPCMVLVQSAHYFEFIKLHPSRAEIEFAVTKIAEEKGK